MTGDLKHVGVILEVELKKRYNLDHMGFLRAQCLQHHIALEGHPTMEHVRTGPHRFFVSISKMRCPASGVGPDWEGPEELDCSEDWSLWTERVVAE